MKTDLENIRRLLAAGTPMPWSAIAYGHKDAETSDIHSATRDLLVSGEQGAFDSDDADLIVALVNAAPDLIAELEALRAFVEEVRTLKDWPEPSPRTGEGGLGPLYTSGLLDQYGHDRKKHEAGIAEALKRLEERKV